MCSPQSCKDKLNNKNYKNVFYTTAMYSSLSPELNGVTVGTLTYTRLYIVFDNNKFSLSARP